MRFISVAVVFGVGALGETALEQALKKEVQGNKPNPFYEFAKVYEEYHKGDIVEAALEREFNKLVKDHNPKYSFAQFKNNQKALEMGGLNKKWYVLRHRKGVDKFLLIPAVTADLRYMNIVTLGLNDHGEQASSPGLRGNLRPETPTRRTGIEVVEEIKKATTQVKKYSEENPGDIQTQQNEDDILHMWGGVEGHGGASIAWLHCRIGYKATGISAKEALEVLKWEAEGKGKGTFNDAQKSLEELRKKWREKAGIASLASS